MESLLFVCIKRRTSDSANFSLSNITTEVIHIAEFITVQVATPFFFLFLFETLELYSKNAAIQPKKLRQATTWRGKEPNPSTKQDKQEENQSTTKTKKTKEDK
jgi:hypothetical protein